MQFTTLEKMTVERGLVYLLIFAVIFTFGFIFYLLFSQITRYVTIVAPKGGERWEIGQTYKIEWKSRGVQNVGIVLFKGKEPKWIKKNIPASFGKYEWPIEPGQQYGDDYWMAVFEYPYKKGNKISYSPAPFVITYPTSASCDTLSVDNEWPYVPGDLPNIRKVFFTKESYTGKLGGFDGADKICTDEATAKGLTGKWHAFIGGDADEQTATSRLASTPRKTEGVFVEALPAGNLLRGVGCHRVLGKNYSEFIKKFSDLAVLDQAQLSGGAYDIFGKIWLGRLDGQSKKNCAIVEAVSNDPNILLAEKYSGTTTCQNWTTDGRFVEGYSDFRDLVGNTYPLCYTPTGISTKAVSLAGLSIGSSGKGLNEIFSPNQGKRCSEPQKLICVEE